MRALDAAARKQYRIAEDARGVVVEAVTPGGPAAEKDVSCPLVRELYERLRELDRPH